MKETNMNMSVKSYDSDGMRILKRKTNPLSETVGDLSMCGFYNQFDGYNLEYIELSGTVDNRTQVRLLIQFLQVVEDAMINA